MTAPAGRAPFRLGAFTVDPQRNRIAGAGGETALQPKVMDLLCALADRPGEVLSRTALIDAVWGKEFGADESLTRAVSTLRKALGDSRGEPVAIETISKRGYRLLVAPEPAAATLPLARSRRRVPWLAAAGGAALAAVLLALLLPTWRPHGAPAPIHAERTGIVVTVEPFAGDGSALAEDLGAAIARSPLVRARSGPAPGPAEAGTLQYRLRGEIRHVGDRRRIGAQLVDAATGEVRWSERYDFPYDAQFSARDVAVADIARDSLLPLLRAAKGRLAARPPSSLAPWEAVLMVTWVPGDEGRPEGPPSENSYWLQRHALAIDPDYAPAHALFAEMAAYHALFHPPADTQAARDRARRHAERALELAPYDAEVLYQLALYYRFNGDRARAAATLERVLDLQPGHPLARIDLDFVRGQCAADPAAALASLHARIAALPPSSPARWVALSHLSSLYLGAGDAARARDAALASRRIIPMTWTAFSLAAADAATGRDAEAAAVLAEHRREWPAMDLDYFAKHVAARWCLNGPRTNAARTAFVRLAAAVKAAEK